jgi:alpha-galactosidase
MNRSNAYLLCAVAMLGSYTHPAEASSMAGLTPQRHTGATLRPHSKPFVAGHCTYTDGVSVSGSCEVAYVVPAGVKRFEAMAGLMKGKEADPASGVLFTAAVDGALVYNSGKIAFLPWNRPSRMWIPVRSGQTLALSIKMWGDTGKGWNAVWAEPRFIPADAKDWTVPPPAPEGALAPTPPMGWNSWYVYKFGVNESKMKRAADLLVEKGFKDAGYIYCNLDDGWTKRPHRRADGSLAIDRKKFPRGLKAVGDYIHAKGLKFGMYGRWDRMIGEEKSPAPYARMIADAGADFLKYDFVSPAPKKLTLQMLEAVRATGRPITFLACTWGLDNPWEWGPAENVQLWRSGYDIRNAWSLNKDNHIGILDCMDRNEPLAKYQRPGHWNDPDMLLVGGGIGLQEHRSQFGMWCIMGSPLVIGMDLGKSSSEKYFPVLLNREAIAVNQDPLGIQGWRVQKMDQTEVWMKPLAGGDLAVAMLNRGKGPVEIKALRSHLCLEGRRKVRDIWQGKDLGTFGDVYAQTVPGHGVALLRLSQ